MKKVKAVISRVSWISGVFLFFLSACFTGTPPSLTGSLPPDYKVWNKILEKYVNDNGDVDYEGLKQDSMILKTFLDTLATRSPDEASWSREEQIAYWINAYNAFTLKLIIDHYPLGSIKDIGSSIQIPFVYSPWDIKFIKIHGQALDLNDIEHGILRRKFDEPRIHFAVNCASRSCPPLRREAYSAEKLNAQLDDQARRFINDPSRNKITKDDAFVSKIFQWYGSDFTKSGSLKVYVNKYSKIKIDPGAEIKFMFYDWSLNEQQSGGGRHHRQTSTEAF